MNCVLQVAVRLNRFADLLVYHAGAHGTAQSCMACELGRQVVHLRDSGRGVCAAGRVPGRVQAR